MGNLRVAACAALIIGCGTGDNRVDPGDLELRDLLGISPETAGQWDAAQRASARQVIAGGLAVEKAATPISLSDPTLVAVDDRVARSLGVFDATRVTSGADAAGVVAIGAVEAPNPTLTARAAPRGLAIVTAGKDLTTGETEIVLDDRWAKDRVLAGLAAREVGLFAALASDAGHTGGKLVVVPAPRLAAVAGYVEGNPGRLVVNPVLLAAIDPIDPIAATGDLAAEVAATGDDVAKVATPGQPGTPTANLPGGIASTGGNPYSFYGSVAECAAAQRDRCDSCMAGGTCKPVTTDPSGSDECTQLGAAGGRGYYLLCINLSLAISSVDDCVATKASSCARVAGAASDLAMLNANADFLDTSTCSQELDACLSSIYGAPSGSFPSADGGTQSDPPRNTSASCTTCSNNNCDASPNCSGPTCGNSFSCDSTCSSSTDQKGCGGDCDGCKSSGGGAGNSGSGCSSGGTTGGGCGGSSGSGSSSGCSGNGNSCSSGNSSGCSGSSSSGSSSCGGSSSGGGSSCGGGSSGGGCGGSSSSSSSSSCGGGGSSGGCSVGRAEPDARVVLGVSVAWGFLPVPIAAMIRRRARKQKTQGKPEVAS